MMKPGTLCRRWDYKKMIDLTIPDILPKEETKHCTWCKHHIETKGSLPEPCKKCLENSREKPFWELKTKQETKIVIKEKPKFKRKLSGFAL